MFIIYRNKDRLKFGTEADFRNLKRLDFNKQWYLGIDGSSTSYGLSIYTFDYSQIHLFIFCRDSIETAETFRATLYQWLQTYLYGISMQAVTYEKTPEGYKPPSSHAEKVMRETESAIKNFVYDRNYLMTRGKDFIFDIFPNSWKYFSVPKSRENLGKIDKELNARAVLESCGLDADKWLSGFDRIPYKHDYDCFEALGVGRYGSHFILKSDSTIRIYKNFSKITTHLIAAKRIDVDTDLVGELEFIGKFGSNKIPRMCAFNENHSVPENLLGLSDKEFNNILTVKNDDPLSIYLDSFFGFKLEDTRDYIIVGVKTGKTDLGAQVCEEHGYVPIYM